MHALDLGVAETPELLLAAIEQANDGIVIVDDFNITHFNAAAEQIWGVNRSEVLGRHVRFLGLSELQHAQAASGNESAAAGTSGADHAITIHRGDGRKVRARLSLSHPGAARTIAWIRDVTAESQLQERLGLIELIADGTNRAVLVIDYKFRIVFSNAAFSQMFGYSLEEANGKQAYELLTGRHTSRRVLARMRRLIEDARCGEEEILSYE